MTATGRKTAPRLSVGLFLLAGPSALLAADVPFAAPQDLALGLYGVVVGTADLDRDGDLDVVAHGDEQVRFLEQGPLGTFTLHECYAFPSGSYVYEARLADLDRDGDPDVVTHRTNDELDEYVEWLENDGTPGVGAWTKRQILFRNAGLFIVQRNLGGLAVADIDGDGDPDVAYAMEEWDDAVNSDGRVDWAENDGASPPGWSSHTVQDWWPDREPQAIDAGDFDGDGDVDLAVSIPHDVEVGYLYWYENDGTPANGAWSRHNVAGTVGGPRPGSLAAGDLERDGDLDLMAYTAWESLELFENDGTPDDAWPHLAPTFSPVCCEAGLSDLDGDGWLDIVLGGDDAWFENRGGSFVDHDLPTFATSLQRAGDLDRDGDPDLVYVADGGDVAWSENLTIHRTARLLAETAVNDLVDEAFDAAAADLDRDGDLDLVSAAEANDHVYWHRNSGTPVDDVSWNLSTLTSAVDGPRAVAVGDLDADGDPDVVVASYNDNGVSWLENDGTLANWTKRAISTGAGGANDVLVADFDRDGDLDVACAQYLDDEISWYRNNGGSPPTFSAFFVDSLAYDGPRSITAGDLDGDGDLDLAAVSETADAVVWYTNDGTPADGEWTRHRTDNGECDGPKEVSLADLDRDGDLDSLVAAYVGDKALWYENDGTFAGWTARTITTCGGARGIAAGDFDRDGDLDALVSCYDDDTVKLQRNNGSTPPSLATTLQTLTGANGARSLLAADLDRDGHLDGVVVEGTDDQIAWYESRAGQFRVTGVAAGGNPLFNDQLEVVLRAIVAHRGQAGDGAIELAAVPVRLEESAGDPLNALQAASLIDAVRLYGDDGDLVFEPATDPLVGLVAPAGIDGQGVVWIDLAPNQVAARVSAVQQKSFFVVLDLARPFGLFAAGTTTLRASLVSSSPAPEAIDADFDLPLDAEWAADAPTALLVVVDVVFRDDLESGGLGNWSSHLP